jgi:hypothetical protein
MMRDLIGWIQLTYIVCTFDALMMMIFVTTNFFSAVAQHEFNIRQQMLSLIGGTSHSSMKHSG